LSEVRAENGSPHRGDGGRDRLLASSGNTGAMLHWVNWASRVLGFVWLGIFSLILARSHAPAATAVQLTCYLVAGAAIVVWALIDRHPGGARSHPLAYAVILAVVCAATGVASAAGGGGTLLVIYTAVAAMMAGSDVDGMAALAITATGILAIDVSGLVYGSSVALLLGFPAVVLAGLLTGRNRADYRIQADQAALLLTQQRQLQAEQRRAEVLDERARIAREIHDVLAHSLGALGIQIQAARAVLSDRGNVEQAGELLATAQQMAAEGLVETRRAIHALRTDTRPLDEELAQVSDTYARRYHVAVSFDTGGVPAPLAPDATVALLRTAQEALVNAAKHATGQGVAVRIDYGDGDVRLTVSNDLPAGASTANEASPDGPGTVNGGYGLTGMRERLRLLNGTLQAGRRGDQWIVTAQLPRPEPASSSLASTAPATPIPANTVPASTSSAGTPPGTMAS
jgi:signal transduction histidine kinase